jgi:hypothetical protein
MLSITGEGSRWPLVIVVSVEIFNSWADAKGMATIEVVKRNNGVNIKKTLIKQLLLPCMCLSFSFIISTPASDHFHDRLV